MRGYGGARGVLLAPVGIEATRPVTAHYSRGRLTVWVGLALQDTIQVRQVFSSTAIILVYVLPEFVLDVIDALGKLCHSSAHHQQQTRGCIFRLPNHNGLRRGHKPVRR